MWKHQKKIDSVSCMNGATENIGSGSTNNQPRKLTYINSDDITYK